MQAGHILFEQEVAKFLWSLVVIGKPGGEGPDAPPQTDFQED